jgi:hypothetical protein
MIDYINHIQFETLTSRLAGYSRCTKHTVSYVADGIELLITDQEESVTRRGRIQITYLRYGHTRISCDLWKYTGPGDLAAFNEILDLLLEGRHPTLTRE